MGFLVESVEGICNESLQGLCICDVTGAINPVFSLNEISIRCKDSDTEHSVVGSVHVH